MRKLVYVAATVVGGLAVGGLAVGGLATPAMADVKAGVDAWGRADFRKAIDEWRGPAMAGDADAQFNMGQAYKLGRGVPLDPAMAESWFRKAAMQGHLQAQDNYGLALFQSDKKADALPWLEKSVARGEPRAQLVLGTMLFNGDGVPRDYPRAYALMTRASTAGLRSASETLLQMDQYISPADRERGTALAAQYAMQTPAPQAGPAPMIVRAPMRQTDVPPSRPVDAPMPRPVAAAKPAPPPVRVAAMKPAPKPTPKPAPAPARSSGGWRIQLGAFKDQSNAEALWGRVHAKLGNAQPAYVRAGGITRLQAGGYGSKAEAAKACSASGLPCVVVAP